MALSLAAFRARYPEFDATGDELVSECLAEALLDINATVYGARANAAQAALAAHLLASTAFGRDARLNANTHETTYLKIYEDIRKRVGFGFFHVP